MSSLTMQYQKERNPHSPNQFVSDMKQYFTKVPKQARLIYIDETPDSELHSKRDRVDSYDARGITHHLFSPREPQKWKSYPFKIMYLVASFLYKVKTSTDSFRFKLLDRRTFRLINDLSSDYNYYQKRYMFKKQIGHLQVFLESCLPDYQLKLFQPDDLIKVVFDTMLAVMTAFILIYVPILISFNQSHLGHNIYFDVMPAAIILFDLIIKLNSAFYKDGVIIQSRKQIALEYFKNDLLFDMSYIFAFLISLNGFHYLQLTILLRLKDLKDITFIREKYATQVDLIKLIFFLFYINHNGACLWNFIGELQLGQSTQNWIHFYDVLDASFSQRYIRSFYWCMITTTTVGYGDLVPTNDLERLVCCLIIISGQIAFGYTISSIGEIFKQIEEKNNTFKTQMSKVTYYLKQKNFDKQLQMKIIRQLKYLYSQKYKSDHNEIENLITQLLPEMAAEVKIATYLPILLKNKIFRTKFSSELLNDLSQIMITKSFNNGQIIIDTNQTMQSLIFIAEGSLAAIAQSNYLRSYQSGFIVGLKNFIIQQPVPCSFKAETSCTLYLLPYEGFIEVLRKHQEDWENFQMLKDDLIFKQQQKQISEVCKVCKSNHNFLSCPFPFFQFNRNRVMRSQFQEQTRVFQYRRNNKMMGFRQAMQDYQFGAINASLKFTTLKEEDIDASYEAKLGLASARALTLPFNQPTSQNNNQGLTIDYNQSLKEITSKIQMNSLMSDNDQILKDNKFSNLHALPLIKQTSIKRTSYSNQKHHSILQLKPEPQFQSKEFEQIEFSQLEYIQQEIYMNLQNNVLNLDKYADFKYYNQGQNLGDILNHFIELKSKQTQRHGSANRYLQIKKQPLGSQRSSKRKLDK